MTLHPRVSRAALDLVKRVEPFRPNAEPRPGGGWVIGYGHTLSAREGARVGQADAEALLVYDLSRSAERVEAALSAPVDATRFEALVALDFLGPAAFPRLPAAGEPSPARRDAAAALAETAPSATLAATDALRDRLDRILAEPEPEREPQPEPAPAPTPASELVEEPEPPPLIAPTPSASDPEPPSPPEPKPEPEPEPQPATAPFPERPLQPEPPVSTSAPPGFGWEAAATPAIEPRRDWLREETGGRRRASPLRLLANPLVATGLAAAGVVMFACALIGMTLGQPTPPGLALGAFGVLCMTPGASALLGALFRRRDGF